MRKVLIHASEHPAALLTSCEAFPPPSTSPLIPHFPPIPSLPSLPLFILLVLRTKNLVAILFITLSSVAAHPSAIIFMTDHLPYYGQSSILCSYSSFQT